MTALERRPRAIDVAAQAAHLPLRVYVMGDRAVRREPATPDDIAEMRRLTVEALQAGAFGFTTSRTNSHKTPDGELVPSRDADADELRRHRLGARRRRCRRLRHELGFRRRGLRARLDDELGAADRPPDLVPAHRPLRGPAALAPPASSDVHRRAPTALAMTAQIAGRPIGVMMGIGTALNPFTVRPSYKPLESLPIDGAAPAAARPGAAAHNSRRTAVGRRSSPSSRSSARLVATQWDRILRHGQSAGLRAGAGEERRRHRRAHRPAARRGRLRLHRRRRRPISCYFPVVELRHRRPRADP